MTKNLLAFGMGYSARVLCGMLLTRGGWSIWGTSRTTAGLAEVMASGFHPVPFQDADAVRAALRQARYSIVSAPPGESGDPVLAHYGGHIEETAKAGMLKWVGYLSTIGVYGDHGGGWVDEETPPHPQSTRSIARLHAEEAWRALAAQANFAADIYRLAGIYGPGRSPVDRLRLGDTQRIVKPGQVFNRIHVKDIAAIVQAGLTQPGLPGQTRIFNVTDDEPAPPQDVTGYAARLMGIPLPPPVAFENAELSEMARSFYAENKRVSNARIKRELGVQLKYPSYREGLHAILNS